MYLLLLPVFFVLHGLNAFWLLLPIRVLFGLLVSYISIAVITGVLTYFLFKEGVKAFIFAFYILLVFFFFGSVHDWLKASIGENRFSSYSFLLSFFRDFIPFTVLYFEKGQPKRKENVSILPCFAIGFGRRRGGCEHFQYRLWQGSW